MFSYIRKSDELIMRPLFNNPLLFNYENSKEPPLVLSELETLGFEPYKECFFESSGDYWEDDWAGVECHGCGHYISPEEGTCHTCDPDAR